MLRVYLRFVPQWLCYRYWICNVDILMYLSMVYNVIFLLYGYQPYYYTRVFEPVKAQ